MKTLKESLLDNTEKSLAANPASIMCPVPKVRDFKKNFFGTNIVTWECPELIQPYINNLEISTHSSYDKSKAFGFKVAIVNKYELHFDVMFKDRLDSLELKGFGTDGSSIPTIKKSVIEFFNYVANNPDCIITIFDHANKSKKELNTVGMCNELTFKQVLK